MSYWFMSWEYKEYSKVTQVNLLCSIRKKSASFDRSVNICIYFQEQIETTCMCTSVYQGFLLEIFFCDFIWKRVEKMG